MLSVVLASHNGASVLPRTLQGYERVVGEAEDCLIVVVDSASTDETPDIISNYANRLPIRSVRVAEVGKNLALNAALALVRGDAVVFTDDDAIPSVGFLREWTHVVANVQGYDVFGGSVTPHFDTPPPNWLLRSRSHFSELYAAREGIAEGPIDPRGIFGPNMAVRMKVFGAGLKFDESVGPNAAQALYAMGSETTFCLSAARRGHKTYFAPGPKVEHIVRCHQLTAAYFRARAYRLGRGAAYQARMSDERSASKSAVRRAARSAFGRMKIAWAFAKRCLARDPLDKFETEWIYEFTRGFEDERRRVRDSTPKPIERARNR